jgi:hypothetical protein
MGAVIPAKILGLKGQVIKEVVFNEEADRVRIMCDCFHVMQMFGEVIHDCHRAEFKAGKTLGDLTGQQTIKGSLLLSNRTTLQQTDREWVDQLLDQNQHLSALYTLKEQSSACLAAQLDARRHGGQHHRTCPFREGLAGPPHRYLRLCRSSDHYCAT